MKISNAEIRRYCHRYLLLASTLALGGLCNAKAEVPDFLADTIGNVGGGYFDTGYKFKMSDYPKTTGVSVGITMTDDTVNGNNAAVFGYWVSNSDRMFFRFSSTGAGQAWYDDSYKEFGSGWSGDVTMYIDYVNKHLCFNTVTNAIEDEHMPSRDGGRSFHVFGYNRGGSNFDNTKFKFRQMQVMECASDSSVALVHEYVPCYSQGRPALYDTVADTVIFGSGGGFRLYGYDIAVAAGKSMIVSESCSSPRSLTLNAGAEYVFDGASTLTPDSVATIPGAGKVKVSLSANSGQGEYLLIDNLPSGYSLDSFELGSLPVGVVGSLVKDGGKLKLRLAARDISLPEAIGGSIRNDGVGYFNCGYKYKTSAFPKTARLEVDFSSTDYGAGTAPEPVISNGQRALWGYGYGDDKFFFRYSDRSMQVWHNGGWNACSVPVGDASFCGDYMAGSFTCGNSTYEFTAASRDSEYAYLLFARCNGSGSVLENSIYDLRAYRVYVTDDGVASRLAFDYRPACMNGVNGLFDAVSGGFVEPTANTSDFTLNNVSYRLSANGEVAYVSGEQSVASIEANAEAWELVRDSDGTVVESGTGATAEFTMPQTAASLRWKHSLSLADGETKSLDGTEAYVFMSVAGAARLDFGLMSRIVLDDGLVLGNDAAVDVSYADLHGAGVYTLIKNAGAGTDVSKFSLETLPEGLSGEIALSGADLVLKVRGAIAGEDALPDRMLTYVRNDGVGYLDTGYKYHVSTYPKTVRLELDYHTDDAAGGTAGIGSVRALFGYQDSYHKLIVRYSNSAGQIWSAKGYDTCNNVASGDLHCSVDYLGGTVSWGANSHEFTVPDRDAAYPYLLFARGSNASVTENSLFDLQSFRIWERSEADADPVKVHDYRPCVKGGRLALYDLAGKTYKYLDDVHFAAGEASYPADIYGTTSVTQEFPSAWTVSSRAVKVRPSDIDHCFTFIADGQLVLKQPTSFVSISRHTADGSLVECVNLGPQVAGANISVTLDGAVKVVVRNKRPPFEIIIR